MNYIYLETKDPNKKIKISKEEIASKLYELAKLEKDRWRSIAYFKAANSINIYKKDINDIDDFKEIPGVGKSIAAKIEELISSGEIGKLTELKKSIPVSKERINLSDANTILKPLIRKMKFRQINFQVCGSIRRKAPTIGDIDILVDESQIELCEKIIEDVGGESSRKGAHDIDFTFNGISVNFRAVPKKSWGAGVLFFTGSKNFNIMMRIKAKRMGFKLNRYGLFDANDKNVASRNEEDIFKKLDMKYINPENR